MSPLLVWQRARAQQLPLARLEEDDAAFVEGLHVLAMGADHQRHLVLRQPPATFRLRRFPFKESVATLPTGDGALPTGRGGDDGTDNI